MDRPDDDELLSAYLDDELSADERAHVERLLAERPEAQRLLDELRAVREQLQSLPRYRLEADFGDRVLRLAERDVLHGSTSAVLPEGDEIADRSILEAWKRNERWKRPLAWSVLVVAAAVVLMFVDRGFRRDAPVAMRPAPTGSLEHAEKHNARPAGGAKAERADAPPSTDALGRNESPRDERGSEGTMRRKAAAPAMPSPPADGPSPEGVQFSIQNRINPRSAVDGTAPSDALGDVARGAVAPKAANTVLDGIGAASQSSAVAANGTPSANMAKTGVGSLVAGPPLQRPMQTLNPQIDTMPLVADADYARAQVLIAEYEEARRSTDDRRDATRAFSRRLQEVSPQSLARATNEQLLIVQCDVTSEALERGLSPVLAREQIADLTQARSQTTPATPRLRAAAESDRNNGAAADDQPADREEFVYVVAESRQVEEMLDALRRQPELFVNVEVEPAPANLRQQAWRGYSRSRGAAVEMRSPSSVTSPVAGPPEAPPSTAQVPGPAPTSAAAAAKPDAASLEAASLESDARKANANKTTSASTTGTRSARVGESQSATAFSYAQSAPLSRAQRLQFHDLPTERESERLQTNAVGEQKADALRPAAPVAMPSPTTPAITSTPSPPEEPLHDKRLAKAKKQEQDNEPSATTMPEASIAGLPGRAGLAGPLPPDYHEALFIFRVIDTPSSAAAPGGAATPGQKRDVDASPPLPAGKPR